jgi:hypothetical protein
MSVPFVPDTFNSSDDILYSKENKAFGRSLFVHL